MIHIQQKSDCCGCGGCAQACPRHAIQMKADEVGFQYPQTDSELCIDCGLCNQVCPMLHPQEARMPLKVFAAKNRNETVRSQSSSGGLFTVLAKHVLAQGGHVYGAAFTESWDVCHIDISEEECLWKLRGSKYVQSSLGNSYRDIKKQLNEGEAVLFSGTPCQIAGLRQYLRKDYDKLLTVDVVCHGVPNPRIWREFLDEQQYNASLNNAANGSNSESSSGRAAIEHINFRDKSSGWKNFMFSLKLKNQDVSATDIWKHPYMLLFLKDYILRPSCHNCRFKCGRSGADYSLADFWGIEKFHPDFSDDKGVSLVMQYREDLDEALKESEVTLRKATYEEAAFANPAILRSWPAKPESKFFYFTHDRLGWSLEKSLYFTIKITDFRERCRQTVHDITSKIIVELGRIKRLLWQK